MATSDLTLLDSLLQEWRELLSLWAQNGTLTRAAQEALQLEGEPEKLRELVGEWSQCDYRNLPPVVLLPASAMPGAAGAYAISTGTIYLNQDWLRIASNMQALLVLSEELGHHLDDLLNFTDTDGDEGKRFALLLENDPQATQSQFLLLTSKSDNASLDIDGNQIAVEQSSLSAFGINLGSSSYIANKFSYTTASSGYFQCTTYAFGRALELGFYSANIVLLNKIRNNGGEWDNNVGSSSFTSVASSKSFIVWDPYTAGTEAEGHVGFVEDIKPDGTLVISEANYRKQNRNPSFAWSTETISPGSSRYSTAKFIPLAGGSSTPPPPTPPPADSRLAIPIFDPSYYLATYADVRNAYGASNLEGAKSHWLQFGIKEGRRGSLVFDPKYYLKQFQDVANAYGATNYAGAISHWLEWGLKYGRRGSVEFDPIYYMAAHPDVEKAYGVMNFSGAISHYYQWGKPGGWYGSEWITDSSAFQLGYYLANNADVKAVTSNANQEVEATRHWYFIGINEGRRGSPEFDANFYLAKYEDVRAAYGATNYRGALDNYLLYGKAGGRIGADDRPRTLSIGNATITEGDAGSKILSFTVTLNIVSGEPVTVNFSSSDGSAQNGSDYISSSGQLIINPGELSRIISVEVLGDITHESNETFSINLFSPTHASIENSQGLATIQNDDDIPSITIANQTITETDSSQFMVFTVSLSRPSDKTVSVSYSADLVFRGRKYTLTSGSKAWAQAQSEALDVGGNLVPINSQEEEQRLQETFGTSQQFLIGLTDQDKEGEFKWISGEPVTYSNWLANEPNDAGLGEDYAAMNTAQKWNDISGEHASFSGIIETIDWTEYNGSIYTLTNTAKTWEEAQAEALKYGGNLVCIGTPQEEQWLQTAYGTDHSFWIGLTDKETEGLFKWINGETVAYVNWLAPVEPNDGLGSEDYGQMNFSGKWNDNNATRRFYGIIEVRGTLPLLGQAKAGVDYTTTKGQLLFNPGETAKTFSVQVLGDTAYEQTESFNITLSGPSNAVLGINKATATISDNDLSVITLVVDPTAGSSEDGTTNLVYTFSRTGPTTSALTVNYTVGGTATLGTDYTGIAPTPATKTVSFAAGSDTAIVTVDPTADVGNEADETVTLSIATGSGYSIITTTAVVGMILNDDPFINPLSLRRLEIWPGNSSGNPSGFMPADDRLYFSGNDGSHGEELWWSDGSSTFRTGVKSYNNALPRSASSLYANIANDDPAVLGNSLFFSAYSASNGWALWRYDGTAASLVKDFLPNGYDHSDFSTSWSPYDLTTVGEKLFFSAPILRQVDGNGDGVFEQEFLDPYLWYSDGTAAGTLPLTYLPLGTREKYVVGNLLYFTAFNAAGDFLLWRSDGTPSGTIPLKAFPPYGPLTWAQAGNRLFYEGIESITDPRGAELWTSDGSAAGTVLVKDIAPGPDGSQFAGRSRVNWAAIGNTLYFIADDGSSGMELWKSDGSATGTVRVADINPGAGGSNPSWLQVVGDTLFFSASSPGGLSSFGNKLWKSDGTTAGTVPVADASSWGPPLSPEWLTTVGNTLYFTAINTPGGTTPLGRELWKSDGTAAGTVPVADINPGSGSSWIEWPTLVGDTLFFRATDANYDTELWALDVSADLPAYINLETQGNTSLVRHISTAEAYISAGAITSPITYLGTSTSPGNISSTWQMLAAETIGGSNKLLWRYNPTGQLHLWALNSNWGWTGGDTGLVDANSSDGWGLESSFQLDLNGDSIIGAPYTTIESQGNTSLVRNTSAQAYVNVGATATPITYIGTPTSPGNISSTWQMLAAETIGGSNKLLWRYNPTGQLHVWALNSNWGWTGGDTGLVDANSSDGWGIESSFQFDLNADSIIGAPLIPIESQGNTSLGRHNSTAQAYVSVGNSTTPITYIGTTTSPGNTSSTWQMLAAETIGGSNKLLWRYNPTGQLHVWALNSNWGWTGGDTGLVDANSSDGWGLESSFQLDLNGDSIIGAPYTTIESQGNTSLVRNTSAQAYVNVGATATPITYLGTPTSPGNTSSTWQMLAAETIGGSNKLLWRYNPTGQLHVWALNSNWGWTGSDTGLVDANSSAGFDLLAEFGVASI